MSLARLLASYAFVGTASFVLNSQAVGQGGMGYQGTPVIEPAPDENGVDISSGAMMVSSPIGLQVPAASKLGVKIGFNGYRLNASINAYIVDETFTHSGGDANVRYITVHLGELDKIFSCSGYGTCSQLGKIDGASLIRESGDIYNLIERDGTRVRFFRPSIDSLPNCENDDSNCAGYWAYAHASFIIYPDGETLTFQPYPKYIERNGGQFLDDSVISNLGYTLDILYPVSNPPSPVNTRDNAGISWLKAVSGNDKHVIYEVSYGPTRLKGIKVSREYAGETRDLQLQNVSVVDDNNRNFTIGFWNTWQSVCGTRTPFSLPSAITTPGGVRTDIQYIQVSSISSFTPPAVRSVTRGSSTWTYNRDLASTQILNSLGEKRLVLSEAVLNPFPSNQYCQSHIGVSVILKDTDGLNRNASYQYGPNRSVVKAVSPELDKYSYERDVRDNVTRVTLSSKPGSGIADIVYSEFGYDIVCSNPLTCNQPNWTRDARGKQTDYSYDPAHGGVIAVTKPADGNGVRPQTRYSYQQLTPVVPTGAATSPIWKLVRTSTCITQSLCDNTADEVVTEIGYNGSLLPISETVRAGDGSTIATTTRTFDTVGNLVAVDGPIPGAGDVTRYVWNAKNELIATMSPDPDGIGPLSVLVTRNQYNADGQPVLIEQGAATDQSDTALASMIVFQQASTEYDGVGRKIAERLDAGGTTQTITQYSYDAANKLVCTALRMNSATFSSLPSSACSLAAEGSQGPDRITRNEYDAAGQLLRVNKADGTPLQQVFAAYSYSPNGKRTGVTDANGNRAEMMYDGFDRQVRWTFPSKVSTGSVDAGDYEEYGYDANGNRTSLRKRDGRLLSFEYDALNRMTRKLVPDGCVPPATQGCPPASATRDIFYGYDLRGLQTYARFDSATGEGVSSSYDGLGRMTSSVSTMGGISREISFEYDASGNRTRTNYPGMSFGHSYDGLNRQTKSGENGASSGLMGLAYTDQGQLGAIYRSAGQSSSYGFDAIGRATMVGLDVAGTAYDVQTTMAYNPASQIVTKNRNNGIYAFTGARNQDLTYQPNGLNQYSVIGGNAYTYDANGNLTADGPVASGATGYGYDAENRLISTSKGVSLTYDPLGRLARLTGPNGTTQFLYDGDQVAAEYDANGNLMRRYLHGPGVDDPLVWYEAGEPLRRYLYADQQGSIIAVTDANGTVLRTNSYDDYGVPAATNAGRFQYTGQAWLPELGMYYYKARIYAPFIGRFLQTDPIGYDDQINLYAYVGNDPVNNKDPDGEAIETVWDVTNIAMGVASAGANIAIGNYGRAAVDVAGVVVDTVAAVVPGVPGGAGTAIRVARAGERVSDVVRGAAGGARAGKSHTRGAVREAIRQNAARNAGDVKCVKCGTSTTPTTQRTKGSTVSPTERQGGHVHPKSKDGDGATVKDQRNIQIECATCNLRDGNKI